jgi:hypothetical protein
MLEGKLYYDPTDGRLYMFSRAATTSDALTGFYPIYDGKKKIITKFSNNKNVKDMIKIGISDISDRLTNEEANKILYKQRLCDNDEILVPQLCDGDNMFTQCVKGTITAMNITMVDLVDMCRPKIEEKILTNMYQSLSKITFMRMDKWCIWVDVILHINYNVTVYKGNKRLLSYNYRKNTFDTGIVKYDDILNTKDDPFKKIIKILIIMENITKSTLKSDNVDDYTINNMMTTLNGKKPLSAQIFSRFIRIAGLSYKIEIFSNDNKKLFEYSEN